MPQCQFFRDGIRCTRNTFTGLTYCWRHWPIWVKGIGLVGFLLLLRGLIGLAADLKGLGAPLPDLWPKENIPNEMSVELLPDNRPTPPNPCNNIPPNALVFLFGNSAAFSTKFPQPIFTGNRDLLSMDKNNKGISISGKIFSADGKVVVEIYKNKIYINPHNYFRLARPNKHSLIVYDQQEIKVIDIYYLNPTTIKFLGVFNSRRYARVTIDENGVHNENGNFHFSEACMYDSGGFISF